MLTTCAEKCAASFLPLSCEARAASGAGGEDDEDAEAGVDGSVVGTAGLAGGRGGVLLAAVAVPAEVAGTGSRFVVGLLSVGWVAVKRATSRS